MSCSNSRRVYFGKVVWEDSDMFEERKKKRRLIASWEITPIKFLFCVETEENLKSLVFSYFDRWCATTAATVLTNLYVNFSWSIDNSALSASTNDIIVLPVTNLIKALLFCNLNISVP